MADDPDNDDDAGADGCPPKDDRSVASEVKGEAQLPQHVPVTPKLQLNLACDPDDDDDGFDVSE
eukprot:4079761-Prorocentrum_lima.AAC.1